MEERRFQARVVWLAFAATVFIFTVLLGELAVSRKRDLALAEERTHHFAIMLAENTGRTFEAIELLLRETAADLSRDRQEWPKWTPDKGWEYLSPRQPQSMPLLREVSIYDRQGSLRFLSTMPSPSRQTVVDRPWFGRLAAGRSVVTFGPFMAPGRSQYSYGIARRIEDGQLAFSGAVAAAIDPIYMQEFCWPVRLSDDLEAVLVGAEGRVVASCRPADMTDRSGVIGAALEQVFPSLGRDGRPFSSGVWRAGGLVVAVAEVPSFPELRIVTGIPEQTLMKPWRERLSEFLILALMVCFTLLATAFVMRRQLQASGRLAAELAASRDQLSERIQQATAEATRQRDAADRANQAKSRFLAAASHDLRQPLHALSLFSADLQRKVRQGRHEELPHIAEQIASSTAIIGELMDSLLDISRLDLAGITPEIRHFALQEMFNRLESSFRRAASERDLRLRFRPTSEWAESDPALFERALANLVSNAVRYSSPGGRVLVAARRRGGRVCIEVRDNGRGIAPEHQQAIFTEFYQVRNEAREHGQGLGLGLSIVDRISKALAVDVGLRSGVGCGTTFSLGVLRGREVVAAAGAPEVASPRLPPVCFFGHSAPLLAALSLAGSWGYPVSRASEGESSAGQRPCGEVGVCDEEGFAQLRQQWSGELRLIVLQQEGGSDLAEPLPEGVHLLRLPLRPAKLRALLGTLQKTSSKSMP